MEIGILQQVLAEEVPYHARVYYGYEPIMGYNSDKKVLVYYEEDLQKENKDMNEDEDTNDKTDGRNEHHYEKAPIAEIRRAYGKDDTVDKKCVDEILDHGRYSISVPSVEQYSLENGWVKDVKVFHISGISLNKKPHCSPYSVKYQSEAHKIEIEMPSHVKNEKGIGQTETKAIDFIINTVDCDKELSVQVDDYEVNYALFSNAYRVEIVINAYHADGRSALNINGKVKATIYCGLSPKKHEKVLFEKENGLEKSEHIATSDTPLMSSVLTLPGLCDLLFRLEISLNDNAGEFEVNDPAVAFYPRRTAIDEEQYILGEKGYILLKSLWACLCPEQEQAPRICTCPSGYALGDFQAVRCDSDSSSDDGQDWRTFLPYGEYVYNTDEDIASEEEEEGIVKKAKTEHV